MVVRNTNRRTIANDLTKLQPKLDPACGVLRMAVGLVAAKKDKDDDDDDDDDGDGDNGYS